MYVFVGGAWPYANGSLHIGHLAGLLPGDVIARYHRQKGDNVLYVSGSDCHGTPIVLRSKTENVFPKEIADRYHAEFLHCFEALGFSFDIYTRTDTDFHKEKVQEIVKKFYENGFIYEDTVKELYCETCKMSLADRFVEGTCPICSKTARGDQCDFCGSMLNPLDLKDRRCKTCNHEPIVKDEKQLFFKLSAFQTQLEEYLRTRKNWRKNSIGETKKYLEEGLVDRAISRNLPLGIDIPIEGFQDKKIYVWFDAVLGYLTASMKVAADRGIDFEPYWSRNAKSYYVHGKDNIPFHSIILPAQLMAFSDYLLPVQLVSSEYMTLEGKKISTSRNWAVWLPDLINKFNPDSIRYFMIMKGPENRDSDFSFKEFILANNSELLGAYGNLVNRTLAFAKNNYDGKIPDFTQGANIDFEIESGLKKLFQEVEILITQAEFKNALDKIFEFIRRMNRYFDQEQPWITVKNSKKECGRTIYNCLNAIKNFAVVLKPFLPFSSEKVLDWLDSSDKWGYSSIKAGANIKDFSILFERLDRRIDQ